VAAVRRWCMPVDYSKSDSIVGSDDDEDSGMPVFSFGSKPQAKPCPNGMVHSPTDVEDAVSKGLEVATFALG